MKDKPAFPIDRGFGEYNPSVDGISKREYFAAKALQGLLSQPGITHDPGYLARQSYKIADAMIKESENTNP